MTGATERVASFIGSTSLAALPADAIPKAKKAIADTFVAQLYDNNGALAVKSVYKVVDVPQTFGGAFSRTSPPPSGTSPECKPGNVPWKVTKL